MQLEKILTLLFISGLFLTSCSNNQEASDEGTKNDKAIEQKSTVNRDFLIGSWKDESKSALDFSLFADGSAQSDNMKTLLYQKWSVEDNRLYLVAKSIGNGTSSIDTMIYDIQKLDEGQMTLKRGELILNYKKVNKPNEKTTEQKAQVVSGELVLGHEANVFKPCKTDKEFWVTDKTGKLTTLYNELNKDKKPYTPIFAEIEIIDKGKAKEGFPAKYDGVYDIIGVVQTRKKSPKDCE